MTDLAKMVVKLEAQTAKYQKDLERAQRANMTFSQKASKHFKSAKMAYLGFAGAVAGAFATVASGIERQADLFDLSTRLGASAEGLSRLQYAAEQSGVSISTLNMGLQRMVRRVAEAANGTGEAKGALEELGVSAGALKQLAPEEQFAVLADKIMAVEDPADRVRLAMKLFDSEGVALIQTMQGGSEQLAKFGEESDQLGRTISTSAAQGSKQASDAITRLSSVITGGANILATQFAPEIEAAANFLATAIPRAVNFAKSALLLMRQGFLSVVEGVVRARIAWNEFTRDFTEAQELQNTLTIIQEMKSDIEGQRDALIGGAKDIGEYKRAAADAAPYVNNMGTAVDNVTNSFERAATSGAGSRAADAAAQEFQALIDSLRTHEEKMIEHYARRKQIIIENTEAESQLRLDLLRRLDEQYLAELDITQQKVEEKKKQIAAPAPETDGTPAIDRIFGPGAISSLFSDFDNIEQRFKEMLARMVAEALASQIANAITGSFGGTGIGNLFGSIFGGARASGGPVSPSSAYLVGEKGPEMFVPNTSGSIVPAHQTAANGGGVTSVVAALGDREIEKWLGSKTGEKVVLAHIKRNQATVRALATR
jgi:hypothetical protein